MFAALASLGCAPEVFPAPVGAAFHTIALHSTVSNRLHFRSDLVFMACKLNKRIDKRVDVCVSFFHDCCRYNTVLAEVARAGGPASLAVPVREERLMNVHEADILVSFLNLLRCARAG